MRLDEVTLIVKGRRDKANLYLMAGGVDMDQDKRVTVVGDSVKIECLAELGTLADWFEREPHQAPYPEGTLLFYTIHTSGTQYGRMDAHK